MTRHRPLQFAASGSFRLSLQREQCAQRRDSSPAVQVRGFAGRASKTTKEAGPLPSPPLEGAEKPSYIVSNLSRPLAAFVVATVVVLVVIVFVVIIVIFATAIR